MLNKNTLDFLSQLRINNSREWFAVNKPLYDKARKDVENLVGQLIETINKFDSTIGYPEPKKCMFRIYRDTRFSTNKDPYKTNMGAIICVDEFRKGCNHADYYLHVEPSNCFISTGIYMPEPNILKAIRTGIYEDFDNFFEIIQNSNFKKTFGVLMRDDDTLQRVPSGFDKNHPSSEYLKLKHFYVFFPVTDALICSDKFINTAVKTYKASLPLKEWLNKIIKENLE